MGTKPTGTPSGSSSRWLPSRDTYNLQVLEEQCGYYSVTVQERHPTLGTQLRKPKPTTTAHQSSLPNTVSALSPPTLHQPSSPTHLNACACRGPLHSVESIQRLAATTGQPASTLPPHSLNPRPRPLRLVVVRHLLTPPALILSLRYDRRPSPINLLSIRLLFYSFHPPCFTVRGYLPCNTCCHHSEPSSTLVTSSPATR
jgi:hypothetical protein